MKQVRRKKMHLVISNVLATIGYIGVVIVLALSVSLICLWILRLQNAEYIVPAHSPLPSPEAIDTGNSLTSLIARGTAYLIAFIGAIISLGILVLLPYLIGRYSNQALRWIFRSLRIIPTVDSLYGAKLIAVVVSFLLLVCLTLLISFEGSYELVVFGAGLTIIGSIAFTIQYIYARAIRIAIKQVW